MAILDTVTKLGNVLLGAFSGPVVPALVSIGKEVLDLIEDVKTTVNSTDADALEELREKLEPLVMAHADKTEASLRG